MEVVLSPLILVQANQLLEAQRLLEDKTRLLPCLLLFGERTSSHIDLQYGLDLPVLESKGAVSYQSDALHKRVELLKSVFPQLKAFGVMFVSEGLNRTCNVKGILDELTKEGPNMSYYFTYNVLTENFELHCYHIEQPRLRIPFRLANNDTLLAAINSSQQSKPKLDDGNEYEKQADFNKKLIPRIDKIISYLESTPVADSILRKVNLLILQLKKAPTADIEQQVTEKEMELQVLNIICNQWETRQVLDRSQP
ncbi:LAME_0G14290g1_1 [Lachancea meyersii CBS 8951]|uniref:LAME_0G14290g1_1 n=1 Tax=Lachancea meyersii CBS 8951 TaxID=1266667 RepID=A0A1G4KAB7_9SACH|nr:LAME_0G14290g1_1 [Lachancea meyersii CBS 8951]